MRGLALAGRPGRPWRTRTLPVDAGPGLGRALYPVTCVLLPVITNVYYQRAGLNRIPGARWGRPGSQDGTAPPGRPAGGWPSGRERSGRKRSDAAAQQQDDEHDDHDDHDGAYSDVHRSGSSQSVPPAQPGG
jgi:hypothetical protein